MIVDGTVMSFTVPDGTSSTSVTASPYTTMVVSAMTVPWGTYSIVAPLTDTDTGSPTDGAYRQGHYVIIFQYPRVSLHHVGMGAAANEEPDMIPYEPDHERILTAVSGGHPLSSKSLASCRSTRSGPLYLSASFRAFFGS